MVGTVSAARHRGFAGAAFAAGLALGAALVFGSLAALGSAVSGRWLVLATLGLAGAAVVSDALGLRVRPQVRFQVPEPWRRTMPLPRALFLYGLLLGTGLTTYVPATAAFALPALSLALGNVAAALAVAAGFAAGRALPVLVLAARSGGETVLAERPHGLRLVRVLIAASLLFALVAGEVRAAGTSTSSGGDPSADGTDLAWQQPGIGGFLERGATPAAQLPGEHPAIGGGLIAWRVGDVVTVSERTTEAQVLQEAVPGVQQLAVASRWLVYRTPTEIRAQAIGSTAPPALVVQTKRPGTLGRPSLGIDLVVFHRAMGDGGSWLTGVNVASGKRLLLRSSRNDLLLNPSVEDGQLLYVRVSRCSQQLLLGPLRGKRDKVLYQLPPLAGQDAGHEPGHTTQGERHPCPGHPKPTARMLWTTALSATTAYVTVLRPRSGGGTTPSLIAVPRNG
jgi:hypothetical protein